MFLKQKEMRVVVHVGKNAQTLKYNGVRYYLRSHVKWVVQFTQLWHLLMEKKTTIYIQGILDSCEFLWCGFYSCGDSKFSIFSWVKDSACVQCLIMLDFTQAYLSYANFSKTFREPSQITFAFFGIWPRTYPPSLQFLCSKFSIFLTTYLPLTLV